MGFCWTDNQYYYIEILERLKKRVMRFRPNSAKNWNLHHNNGPARTAISVEQFLTSKCITVVPQPPYSPVLAPYDFFSFKKVKSAVKGHHFESTEDIQRAVSQAFNDIPEAVFQKCYKQYKYLWERCMHGEGMYFEGDHSVVDE